jgi:hypothetical protein
VKVSLQSDPPDPQSMKFWNGTTETTRPRPDPAMLMDKVLVAASCGKGGS